MDIDGAFPSKYLKSTDLQGRNISLTIDRVEVEEVGFGREKDHKPVVYFQRTKKGFVLNRTNSNTIKAAYGRDTDGWIGKPVVLFPAMVDFAGDTVEAIRVRVATTAAAAKPAPQHVDPEPPPHDGVALGGDMDDEIPF
jgi:hypothetical protein